MPPTEPTLNLSNEDDHALMAHFASGNPKAFDMLYDRHEMGVWRYVFRSVKQAAVADELLQDVWFAVARNAASYQNTARFKTWLFTLAHNRMVDHFRAHKAHHSLDAPDADGQTLLETLAADSGFQPERQLQSHEAGVALLTALASLPQDQREAFLLQAEAGMSVQEIAQTCGVNFETAKSRLRYARSSLRRCLQEFA